MTVANVMERGSRGEPAAGTPEAQVVLRARDPVDYFENENKGPALRARDAAITDTAEFDADEKLCCIVRVNRTNKTFRYIRRDGAWVQICEMEDDG